MIAYIFKILTSMRIILYCQIYSSFPIQLFNNNINNNTICPQLIEYLKNEERHIAKIISLTTQIQLLRLHKLINKSPLWITSEKTFMNLMQTILNIIQEAFNFQIPFYRIHCNCIIVIELQ